MNEKYHYRIRSTRDSSAKYGSCNICGQHASEVFLQIEEKEFFSEETNRTELTQFGCRTAAVGHEHCLLSVRK